MPCNIFPPAPHVKSQPRCQPWCQTAAGTAARKLGLLAGNAAFNRSYLAFLDSASIELDTTAAHLRAELTPSQQPHQLCTERRD